MATRGPDWEGIECEHDPDVGRVWLGHRRLAILDPSASGAQPMKSSCGRYSILYNGEIYNSPELRATLQQRGFSFLSTSDTEVLLNAYIAWGEASLDRLIGMFAFAVWDRRKRELFVARDRLGIKPLYYRATRGGIAVGSDLRAFRALGLAEGLDRHALAAYLALGYVPHPLTIWESCTQLEPGSFFRWRSGGAPVVHRYWQPPDAPGDVARTTDVESLIDEVVRQHMLSDVPVGLLLSGGLDSSTVASSLLRKGNADSPPKPTAFCLSHPRQDDDEFLAAAATARHLGMALEKVSIPEDAASSALQLAFSSFDQPSGYSAIGTQVVICRAASRAGFKVILSGDGGDEVFGGYSWYHDLDGTNRRTGLRGALLRILAGRLPRSRLLKGAYQNELLSSSLAHRHAHRIFSGLLPTEASSLLRDVRPSEVEELVESHLRRYYSPQLPIKRALQRIDLLSFCTDSVLNKVDRASMAFGLEVRPPLLDHRLVELGIAQPESESWDGSLKAPLRSILEARGLGHLLAEPKRGFGMRSAFRLSKKHMREAVEGADDTDLALSQASLDGLRVPETGYFNKLRNVYFFLEWRGGDAGRPVARSSGVRPELEIDPPKEAPRGHDG